MKAIVVTDQAAGTAGMKMMERPKPQDGRALSGAKQAKTRAARAEKCVPMILNGRGFNERTD